MKALTKYEDKLENNKGNFNYEINERISFALRDEIEPKLIKTIYAGYIQT